MVDSRPDKKTDDARLCVVPRWAAKQDMEWYPWLCDTDYVSTRFDKVLRPDVEDYQTPSVEGWIMSLTRACGNSVDDLARTWLLGHSVGCQAIVRYLATLPPGTRVQGCLLVAGWWTLDAPWDTIRPWIQSDEPGAAAGSAPAIDFAHVRSVCPRITVLISDNDPFTSDYRGTEDAWRSRLGAEVHIIPGAKHFNATEAPQVLDALTAFIG